MARRERASRVTVTGLLVDLYCLGVKNVIEPHTRGEGSLEAYRRTNYQAFEQPSLPIAVEQAQAIVYGAVAYARGLGFASAPGFTAATRVLGEPTGELPAIGFGSQDMPFYLNGPHDDARKVLATLEHTRGADNYHEAHLGPR